MLTFNLLSQSQLATSGKCNHHYEYVVYTEFLVILVKVTVITFIFAYFWAVEPIFNEIFMTFLKITCSYLEYSHCGSISANSTHACPPKSLSPVHQ